MRVIGGSARGRAMTLPKTLAVRPTSDRVRESVFDVLSSLGVLVDARVLDLFAGSGALGIEAASRGAAAVTFVESDRVVAKVIEANIAATGVGEYCTTTVVRADAMAYLATARVHFEVALCDPPYAFTDWSELLTHLDCDIAVLESSRPVELGDAFTLHRVYRYGTTLVTVARRQFSSAASSTR